MHAMLHVSDAQPQLPRRREGAGSASQQARRRTVGAARAGPRWLFR